MISANIDLSKLLRKLNKVPREVDRIMEIAIGVEAKGFVRDIASVTPPAHQSTAGSKLTSKTEARKTGEKAVMGDIWDVYASPFRLYQLVRSYGGAEAAKQYWYIKSNKPDKLRRWLELEAPDAIRSLAKGWDEGAAHKRRRTNRGRVAGSRPSVILTGKSDANRARAYIKKKQLKVGFLAAGFNGGAMKLGVSLAPWIRRHGAPFSLVNVQRVPGKFSITIGNQVSYGLKADLARRIKDVLNWEKRGKRLRHRIHAEVRLVLRNRVGLAA